MLRAVQLDRLDVMVFDVRSLDDFKLEGLEPLLSREDADCV